MKDFFSLNDLRAVAAKGNELRFEKSFQLDKTAHGCEKCLLVRTACRFEGAAPHVSFMLTLAGQEQPLYLSHSYRIGGKDFLAQCWRVPPMLSPEITLSVCVEIPAGTVLYFRDFSAVYEEEKVPFPPSPRYNAHLGFIGMSPSNTLPAFRLAALCGFRCCITVPKVTKDGALVCLHDTTLNRTARNPDGSELPDTPLYVSELTYGQLLQYDVGIRKGRLYRGTPIPLLEDFFQLCAETGMDPMFSTHPNLPPQKWLEVKEMLTRYGLLKGFHVKAPDAQTIADAYAVLGSEIDGYTLDVQRLEADSVATMLQTGVDVTRCRVGIEIRYKNCTEAAVKEVLAAGMFAAVWNLPRCSFEEYERLLSYGVTEFTEDYHCSPGLPC